MILAVGDMSVKRINLISFTYFVFLIISAYLGSIIILIFDDYPFNRIIIQINNYETKIYGWLAISYTLLAFPLGIYLARKSFSIKSPKILIDKFYASQVHFYSKRIDSYLRYVLFFLVFISSIVVIYIYFKIGIANYLSGYSLDSQIDLLIRRTSISYTPGIQVLKNIFIGKILPITSYILYVYKVKSNRSIYTYWFWIGFLFTSLGMIVEYKKAPIVIYYLGFFIINIYMRGGLNYKTLIKYSAIVITMLLVIFMFVTKQTNILDLLNPFRGGIAGRILVSQVSSLYAHLEHFPESHEFIGLHSLSNFLSNIMGIEYSERSARIIMQTYAGDWLEMGYGGVMNTIFLGEAWANFGFLGILFAPVYIGFLYGILFFFLLTKIKTPLILGIMTYFTHNSSLAGGFNDYIYNPITGIVIILIIVFTFIYKGNYEQRAE